MNTSGVSHSCIEPIPTSWSLLLLTLLWWSSRDESQWLWWPSLGLFLASQPAKSSVCSSSHSTTLSKCSCNERCGISVSFLQFTPVLALSLMFSCLLMLGHKKARSRSHQRFTELLFSQRVMFCHEDPLTIVPLLNSTQLDTQTHTQMVNVCYELLSVFLFFKRSSLFSTGFLRPSLWLMGIMTTL